MTTISSGIVEFAADNDVEEIERILRFGPECVDERDADGMTALHWACVCGYEGLATMLLEKGACANTRSGADSTPLHDAARNGSLSIVQKLIEKGGDIRATDRDGNTILHEAARNNAVGIVKACLDAEIPVDIQTNAGNTPLHYACMWGALGALALLLDSGAAVNITNNADKSVLDVMLSINDAVRAQVLDVYNTHLQARQAAEEAEQQRLNEERIAEARAEKEAKKRELMLKKQSKGGQGGVYAMILNKKKNEAQKQRETVLLKQAALEDSAQPARIGDDELETPEFKLPPIKKAASQKSISSPNDLLVRRHKKSKSPSKADLLAGL